MVMELKCKNIRGAENIKKCVDKALEKKAETDKAEVQQSHVEWTQDEQNMLQKAVKRYPANLDPQERWTSIANMVGNGKTKKDCLQRVKEIKQKAQKDAKVVPVKGKK